MKRMYVVIIVSTVALVVGIYYWHTLIQAANPVQFHKQATINGVVANPSMVLSTTTQTRQILPSKNCVNGQELIEIQSAPQFLPQGGDVIEMCATKIYGKSLTSSTSPRIKATMVLFKEGPVSYDFIQGPHIETDEQFILFENQETGEKREIGILNLIPQAAIAEIKSSGAPVQFSIMSYFLTWYQGDVDNELWGTVDIRGSADPSPPLYHALFKVNTKTWEHKTYLLPKGVEVGSSVNTLNIKKEKVIYGEIVAGDLLLNVYNLASSTESTIGSYSNIFLKKYYEKIFFGTTLCLDWGENYIFLCQPTELDVKWINDNAISYLDLNTRQIVTKSGL